MNKEEIEKAKIGLWNIRADCLKIIQCGLSDRQDREGCLKEIDVVDDIFKYIKELEQKSEKLDKVTDKLEEDAREEEGYIKWLDERTKEIVQPRKTIVIKSDYARSILNIIEGEKEKWKW